MRRCDYLTKSNSSRGLMLQVHSILRRIHANSGAEAEHQLLFPCLKFGRGAFLPRRKAKSQQPWFLLVP